MNNVSKNQTLLKLGAGVTLVMPLLAILVGTLSISDLETRLISEMGNTYILYHLMGTFTAFLMVFSLWGSGAYVLFVLKRDDSQGKLLSGFFFLYALWIAFGLNSNPQFMRPDYARIASLVLHALTWMLLPVTVHLHYVLPVNRKPTAVSRQILTVLYVLSFLFLLLDVFGILPSQLFLIALLFQVGISGIILFIKVGKYHNLWAMRVITVGMVMTFLPGVVWIILLPVRPTLTFVSVVALMSLSMWPLVYPYALYRHILPARQEKFTRKWMATFVFLLLFSHGMVIAISVIAPRVGWNDARAATDMIFIMTGVIITLACHNTFRRKVMSFLYGRIEGSINEAIHYLSQQMIQVPTRESLRDILQVVAKKITVQDMALYVKTQNTFTLWAESGAITKLNVYPYALSSEGHYVPPEKAIDGFEWVRLVLPLRVRDTLMGILLLGAHKQDHFYPSEHILELEKAASMIATILEMDRQQMAFVTQEKHAAIGRTVASVAHQFNNPLMVLMGAMENLKRDHPDIVDDQWMEMATSKTEHMADVVRSLSQYFSPRLAQRIEVDINDEITEALVLTGPKLKANNVTVNLNLNKVPVVAMFPSELTQVATVLIDNACDAMPAGGELRIESHVIGSTIEVRVSDTGKGIHPDTIDLIFEPWFTTNGGMGLGLAISYGIIERNRGKILVQNQPGQGSLFVVQLPAIQQMT